MAAEIDRLYQLGYLWHVKQDELLQLAPGDPELRKAVLAIQDRYALQFAALQGKHYGELRPQTGEIGPAVAELINAPRECPLPDVPPPPGVHFHFEDPDLQKAVESQQRMAAQSDSQGSGSWPYGCWDGFTMHRLVVAVDMTNATAKWKEHWPWITEQCRINYSWTGIRVDFVPAGERADVRLEFVTRSGGWIGLAEFNGRSCRDEVFCKLLSSYSPNRELMLILLQHELGHNNNLQHSRGGIMNPVINNANPDWRRDTHWSTLKGYYGGQGNPDILGDTPAPQPPAPPPGDHNGVFVYDGKLLKIKVWE